MKKCFLLSAIFLLSILRLFGEEVNFSASVSRNPISVGDQFQVTFNLENADGSGFKAPSFKGFSVLMGPSTSQNMQFVNGKMSRSISYTYVLRADSEGKFTIDPASIAIDGKRIQSNSITMQVVKGAAPQQSQNPDQKSLSQQADEVIRKNLFVRLSINKTNVYQGEQIIATYKLFFNPDLAIVSNSLSKDPTFNGFWASFIDLGNLNFKREIVDGVPFNVGVIKQVVLIPQHSGKLEIEPIELDFVVRLRVQNQQRRRRSVFDDFFDDPFGGSTKDFQYKAKSQTGSITVKPLPPNPPSDFYGAVGRYDLNAWFDRQKTKTGEPVTLKVKISGSGNLKLIEPLNINYPPDFESYDPKITDNISVTGGGVSGSRTFEYLAIPRNAGEFKLDPVGFSYFDLEKKQYVSLRSSDFIIKVEQGSGAGVSTFVSGVNKEDIKYIGKDIRFIKNAPNEYRKRGDSFYGSAGFVILSISPVSLFILFFIYFRKQQKLNKNIALLKNKRATKVARKRLSSAKAYLSQANQDKFYEEVARALWGYLSDKLAVPFADLTKEKASDVLMNRTVPEEKISKCMETIDHCEFARYSPVGGSTEMEKEYNNAASVITDLEGIIK